MLRTAYHSFSILLVLLWTACGSPRETAESPLLVAAASDLAKAGQPLAESFERSSGWRITFSFGSSGQLAQQIRQGAPFDIYAPAARSFCEALEGDGFVIGSCRAYARGRLVAWSNSLELHSLDELKQPQIRQIAMANPETAPYGLAAQQALQAAALWDAVQSKIVRADSVVHAFQMAESGNVDVAFVALALVNQAGRPFYVVDQALHEPIEQMAAVLLDSKNPEAAAGFVDFLFSPEARRILEAYGFEFPE
ncbi:MAG TPA: molybdate ABC transporter substrate-binding protein [Terriglobia bacterium]